MPVEVMKAPKISMDEYINEYLNDDYDDVDIFTNWELSTKHVENFKFLLVINFIIGLLFGICLTYLLFNGHPMYMYYLALFCGVSVLISVFLSFFRKWHYVVSTNRVCKFHEPLITGEPRNYIGLVDQKQDMLTSEENEIFNDIKFENINISKDLLIYKVIESEKLVYEGFLENNPYMKKVQGASPKKIIIRDNRVLEEVKQKRLIHEI